MDYFQLIENVFDSPVLYQYDASRKYFGIKDKAWTKIARNMKVDKGLLRRKWKMLRSQFIREERKISENQCKTTWQYFKHMQFLRDYSHTPLVNKAKNAPEKKPIQQVLIEDRSSSLKEEMEYESEVNTTAWSSSSSSPSPTPPPPPPVPPLKIKLPTKVHEVTIKPVVAKPQPSTPVTMNAQKRKAPQSFPFPEQRERASEANAKQNNAHIQTKRNCLGKLVRLVESEPILYNSAKPSTELERFLVWQDIANALNCSPPISGIECQRKWTGLLDMYTRNFQQKQTEAVTSNDRQKWLFEDAMSFMDKFLMVQEQYDTSIILFFKYILVDFKRLGNSARRKFKAETLCILNGLVEESEKSSDDEFAGTKAASMFAGHDMCPDFMFFVSMLPDYGKISKKQQRNFKEILMTTMHRYVGELEEMVANGEPS